MSDDRIPLNPLDEGDQFALLVLTHDNDDEVTITVPKGKGWVLAAWISRQLTETPELRQEREEADHLAELQAGQS